MRISPPSVETAIRWCVLLPSNSLPLNSIISYHLCRTCGAGDGEKGRAVFKEKEKRSNEERSRELWPKKIWSKEVWWQEKGARGAQFWNVRCCRYVNYINWEAPFPDAAISFPLIWGSILHMCGKSQNKFYLMYLQETLSVYSSKQKGNEFGSTHSAKGFPWPCRPPRVLERSEKERPRGNLISLSN